MGSSTRSQLPMPVLTMNVTVMSTALFGLLLLRGEAPWALVPAVALILVELAVITSFALLFSSITNPILAALMTFAVYVMGHLSWSLMLLKTKLEGAAKLAERIRKKSDIVVRKMDIGQWDREVGICLEIYNEAWEKNCGFVPISE